MLNKITNLIILIFATSIFPIKTIGQFEMLSDSLKKPIAIIKQPYEVRSDIRKANDSLAYGVITVYASINQINKAYPNASITHLKNGIELFSDSLLKNRIGMLHSGAPSTQCQFYLRSHGIGLTSIDISETHRTDQISFRICKIFGFILKKAFQDISPWNTAIRNLYQTKDFWQSNPKIIDSILNITIGNKSYKLDSTQFCSMYHVCSEAIISPPDAFFFFYSNNKLVSIWSSDKLDNTTNTQYLSKRSNPLFNNKANNKFTKNIIPNIAPDGFIYFINPIKAELKESIMEMLDKYKSEPMNYIR